MTPATLFALGLFTGLAVGFAAGAALLVRFKRQLRWEKAVEYATRTARHADPERFARVRHALLSMFGAHRRTGSIEIAAAVDALIRAADGEAPE